MKKSFADILQGIDSAREKKISRKLPDWAADPALEYPGDLCLEQCSSSATAAYKAGLAAGFAADHRLLADITGGLGVDSRAFSGVFSEVDYYEQNTELCQAAGRNFIRLGADNIRVHNETVGPDTCLRECGMIYADPARRSASGSKVFRLEDCTPDVLTLLPMLLDRAPSIMFKLSPMADISLIHQQFGGHLRQLHVVSAGGEVKELLCLLDRSISPEYRITVADAVSLESFSFMPEEESSSSVLIADGIEAGQTLVEPGAAVLKSGAFKLLCSRYGLRKLAPSTHLYIGSDRQRVPLCKSFIVKAVYNFDKASLKALAKEWPKAEVSARNIPLGSDALRKKLGITPGGDAHIFGCGTHDRRNILIICVPADS